MIINVLNNNTNNDNDDIIGNNVRYASVLQESIKFWNNLILDNQRWYTRNNLTYFIAILAYKELNNLVWHYFKQKLADAL